MPTVKALEEIPNERGKRDRRNVVFEGASTVELSLEIAMRAGFVPGREIDAASIRIAVEEDGLARAEKDAMAMLSRKDFTERELRDRLAKREHQPKAIETVIERCLGWGYLDDSRFAERFVSDSIELKRHGPTRIRQALRKRGVPDQLAEEALAKARAETPSLVDQACAALVSKRRSYARLEPEVARRRMTAFLQRRGYDFDTVRSAIKLFEARAEE